METSVQFSNVPLVSVRFQLNYLLFHLQKAISVLSVTASFKTLFKIDLAINASPCPENDVTRTRKFVCVQTFLFEYPFFPF